MSDVVTLDEMTRMVIAAVNGETVVPSSPHAAQVWEQIQREVAEIIARGGMVDIPSDFP
jgi:hypothetical protein